MVNLVFPHRTIKNSRLKKKVTILRESVTQNKQRPETGGKLECKINGKTHEGVCIHQGSLKEQN